MSGNGQTQTGLNKKGLTFEDFEGDKFGSAPGFIMFAHEAAQGDTLIDLSALNLPAEMAAEGFEQATLQQIINANIKANQKKLELTSTFLRQMTGFGIDYKVTGPTKIALKNPAQAGEIYTGKIPVNIQSPLQVVDAVPFVRTSVLAENDTDFGLPGEVPVNEFPGMKFDSFIVLRKVSGLLRPQEKHANNDTNNPGDYIILDNGSGKGNTIRFSAPGGAGGDEIYIFGPGITQRDAGSLTALIEQLAGVQDAMLPFLEAAAGVSLGTIKGAPTYPDLAGFQDRVFSLEKLFNYSPSILLASNQVEVAGSLTAGTYTDANLNLNLSTGIWEIEVAVPLYVAGATGAGVNGRFGSIHVSDNSNNVISNINGHNVRMSGLFANADTPTTLSCLTITTVIEVTTAGVHKVRFSTLENSGATTISALNIRANSTYGTAYFKAKKIETIKQNVGL